MKIVTTSQGTEMSSQVDPRFGRAQYFLLFDTDSDELTSCVSNEQVNAAQGAGVQAAQNVLNLGAEAVITGNIGPKAFTALEAGGAVICIGAKLCCSISPESPLARLGPSALVRIVSARSSAILRFLCDSQAGRTKEKGHVSTWPHVACVLSVSTQQ